MIKYLKSWILERLHGKYYVPVKYFTNKILGSLEAEIRHLPKATCETSIAIDVGANKGAYSFALLSKGFNVVCLEPSNQYSKVLTEFSNSFSRCRFIDAAASDKDGTVSLFRSLDSLEDDSLSSIIEGPQTTPSTDVRAVKIDSLSLENVEFIKIDVEGAEFLVKSGAFETLKQKPTLLVEIERRHHRDKTLCELLDAFCPEGYTVRFLCDEKWLVVRELQQAEIEALQDETNIHSPSYINNFLFTPK